MTQTALGGEVKAAQPGPRETVDLLEQLDDLRTRVRTQNQPFGFWASLVGAVASLGAGSFFLNDQITVRNCVGPTDGQFTDALICTQSSGAFNGWWVWILAAAIGTAVPFVRRYRRGTWRPSPWIAVTGLVVLVLFAPLWLGLARHTAPVVYPAGAAAVLGLIALRRSSIPVTVVSGLLAGAVVLLWWQIDASWFLTRNLGLTLASAAVAAIAFVVAATWAPDRS